MVTTILVQKEAKYLATKISHVCTILLHKLMAALKNYPFLPANVKYFAFLLNAIVLIMINQLYTLVIKLFKGNKTIIVTL